jgi:hypothetical protein
MFHVKRAFFTTFHVKHYPMFIPVKAVLQYHSRLIRGLKTCIFLTGLK